MDNKEIKLPSLNCGGCGFRTCSEFSTRLMDKPSLIKRCIHIAEQVVATEEIKKGMSKECITKGATEVSVSDEINWRDSLGREFDFFLEHFPEEPGPREIIIPHNPIITREMDINIGDILIGRPLGISCGCPVTHCGIVMDVDKRTGVIVWCVTGPLDPRNKGFKDLGYYIAEGYEGLIKRSRCDVKIGMRYFFQPRMCMLQWRHSGLVNYLSRTSEGLQVRLEGLWIG